METPGVIPFDFVEGGGIASPLGFRASGVACGLKKSGNPDLALFCSNTPCCFAGLFTSNLFPAAPVQICRERCKTRTSVRAVVLNSGIANACTGENGLADARETARLAAEALGTEEMDVLVCSTGRIGVPLPMEKISSGIRAAAAALSREGSTDAVRAIMTTDTRPKQAAVSFVLGGKKVTIGAMTKGSGMISPRMAPAVPHATMLCCITTDAAMENAVLSEWLTEAVELSFNRIAVDNDMSTNDTCLILANGASGAEIAADDAKGAAVFRAALKALTQHLAKSMVMDGEGVSKLVTLKITSAQNPADAEKCARAIAHSMLCKTAWFGCDPNWGRILAAAGYSGAVFAPEKVSMDYDELPVVRGGADAGTQEEQLANVLKREGGFTIRLDLGAGDAACTMWTGDLSYEYVKINADYRT